MATLQPRLVRADTLDLQSHSNPSAKDHTRGPTYTPGAHHREALRSAEQSAYSENKASPRVSVDDSQTHLYDSGDEDGDDEPSVGVHGLVHDDGPFENGETDDEDEVEDDPNDRISSSPSIEDGNYFPYPKRTSLATADVTVHSALMSAPTRGIPSSLPSVSPHLRNSHPQPEELESWPASHHMGRYRYDKSGNSRPSASAPGLPRQNARLNQHTLCHEQISFSDSSSENSLASLTDFLLPIVDPLLDNAFDDVELNTEHSTHTRQHDGAEVDSDWIDEEVWYDDRSSTDDDTEEIAFTTSDSRFIDSGWGGECLRETEDIDFEFVYALHTFVATVEGQANASKGDTMVLLDDSNSYWWLVRVVKDGSIGYLPAEHIETPTERLARLNKHRNIDLAAPMLGDNAEKSKNPLKKAMRRRNAKSVAFAPPTYYEPSETAYSSDEEEGEDDERDVGQQYQGELQADDEEIAHAEDIRETATGDVRNVASNDRLSSESGTGLRIETSQTDAQIPDETFQRSRNGVVRNTDSFFKDDTAETKKISLTPALLRGDKATAVSPIQERTSLDTFDRIVGEEKTKEDKKKKEKKGMLSGLFKRKDKKGKSDNEEMHSPDDSIASPTSTESPLNSPLSPDRRPSKLQKTPPIGPQSKSSPVDTRAPRILTTPSSINSGPSTTLAGSSQASLSSIATPSEASTVAGIDTTQKGQDPGLVEQPLARSPTEGQKKSIFAPIATVLPVLKSSHTDSPVEAPVKAVYSKRAKERFAIDASDSEDERAPAISPPQEPHRHSVSPLQDDMFSSSRPDSDIQVSPIEPAYDFHERSLVTQQKTLHHDEDNVTPIDNQAQSDTASTSKPSPSFAAHTPSTSRSTPTWSDASLRSYLDSDQDIRDLLIIVHDKSNVTPVGPEHPLMGGLFMSERTRLVEMQAQLDSMLATWITKKGPALVPAAK